MSKLSVATEGSRCTENKMPNVHDKNKDIYMKNMSLTNLIKILVSPCYLVQINNVSNFSFSVTTTHFANLF